MHACGIKFVGINVRGTRLVSENHEHLYPPKVPAIRYTAFINQAIPSLLTSDQCIECLLDSCLPVQCCYMHTAPLNYTLPCSLANPGPTRQSGVISSVKQE